ncbi:HAD phosphatase [Gloeophyllum trabeum ATCC 11539]|uniref:HAD phosphatase n=1 Tax=Gloeophyllum trabeum (strain ATCC 11539 / FP-39264 / Madison 617) TaxID=670483 RepID=S7RLE0_GLOTA|nr:HAD phosphatase [Gloeophyllum trabeum ATCC 11539]EPQ55215.1 HAD phosphatase [Gloeophyllum trabeum ATCC 11539]
MPLNVPGILVPFQLVFKPRLVLPHIAVKDIRRLDFQALRDAGYRAAVFDKDNCLTIPHEDTLVPDLQGAWKECRDTFGRENVLVVSNSAGTRQDPGGIQAESVSHHLSAPVLRHATPKPGYACISSIRAYFASLPRPLRDSELVVVGDRVFTDVVLANRMNGRRRFFSRRKAEGGGEGEGPLAVWTTGVWARESMFMRWGERQLVRAVERWVARKPVRDSGMFVKPDVVTKDAQEKRGITSRLLARMFGKPEPGGEEKRGIGRRLRHKWGRRIAVVS